MQPEQLGPYAIVRTIGRGGMGAVYEGVHQETQERTAIKVLSPAYVDDPGFRHRFQLEIDALRTLDHPHIVRLTGFGEQEGQLFYTMELVQGESLQDLLSQGKRFTWREVTDYAIQICGALKHAHAHGIVHRDLKPANLMLTPDNAIKLADFGIAKVFGASQHTAIGGVIGTADYMSPEQARGLPISPRSDLFSLGAVMYVLLSGAGPFKAASRTAVLHNVVKQPHRPLCEMAPSTPAELSELLDRLLEKDPEKRTPTAVSLANQLRSLQFGLDSRESRSPDDKEAPEDDFEIDQDDATRAPGSGPSVSGSHYWRETVVADVVASPTVANAPGSTHYTKVKGDAATPNGGKVKGDDEDVRGQWLTTVGLAAALLMVMVLAWLATRPPSAAKLFAKIAIVANQDDETQLIEVVHAMRQFLDLYPDDHRAARVMTWLRDHESYVLWRSIEREANKRGGPEYLDEPQRRFLENYRQSQTDQAAAKQGFRDLAEMLEAQPPPESEQVQEILTAARHRAHRDDSP